LRAHLLTIKDFLESNFPIDIKESGKMSLLNHTIQKNISIIPQLNSGVNLEDTSTMKGLPQKIVAVESVFFIHDALFSLKSQLEVTYFRIILIIYRILCIKNMGNMLICSFVQVQF
jgi:hypothetical protein